MDNDELIVATFEVHSVPDPVKSKSDGRPIYKDMEVCRVRFPGNRLSAPVFPAHEVWTWQENDGMREPVTYAMRFPEQYKRFKDGHVQTQAGTPLEELTSLAQGRRLELKALNIHTVETLAALDGQPLKQIGMDGRKDKNLAIAYLEKATSDAPLAKVVAENADLAGRNELLTAELDRLKAVTTEKTISPFEDMNDDELKEFIKRKTGSYPRGSPLHETLVSQAEEADKQEAA